VAERERELECVIADLIAQNKSQAAELTEAIDLAGHWSIAAQEAQHQARELRAQLDGRKSFGQLHPANPAAKCKCEHWQSCAECHPTAHQPAAVPDGQNEGSSFAEVVRQRDIAVAALEKFAHDRGTRSIAREALKEIGESK
jgi:hypothetical protein